MLTKEEILFFKQNKNEITPELLDILRTYGNDGKEVAIEILDTPKDSEEYYLDAFNNRLSFNGNRRLKKEMAKMPLQRIHLSELQRCRADINYFKDNYVKIKTKKGINFPDLRPYQERVINSISDDANTDNIILMGRQSGKSITISIYLAWCYLFMTETNIGIVGNAGKLAQEFLSNVKNILIELPMWLQVGTSEWNKRKIAGENKMRILTDVPSSDSFRGFTISILVIDEAAFIQSNRWAEFADSIFPSQEGLSWKKNIITSTANGMNHFYDLIKRAKEKNTHNLIEVDWREVPRYNANGTLKTPEQFKEEQVRKNGLVYFNQNFANEFIGSSLTMIAPEKLGLMTAQEPIDVLNGILNVYKSPKKKHNYIMGVDTAKTGKDGFAVQIFDVTTVPFVQVAAMTVQIDYLKMPEFLDEWGRYYNDALIIVENNTGEGQSVADQLYQVYEYENIYFDVEVTKNIAKKMSYPGFRTSSKSRKMILSTFTLFSEYDKIEIVDAETIKQLERFVLVNGKYQAQDTTTSDDCVMATALCFAMFTNIKNFDDILQLKKSIMNNDASEELDFVALLNCGSFDDGTDYEDSSSHTFSHFNDYDTYI